MIPEIRAYIKNIIKTNYPDLKENKSSFYDGDIGDELIDRSYQITLDTITNVIRTDYREYEIPCVVSIFGEGYRSEVSNYDALLDKALCILDNIINLQSFNAVSYIENITNANITAEQLPGNDNSFKIDMNFTITIAYTE